MRLFCFFERGTHYATVWEKYYMEHTQAFKNPPGYWSHTGTIIIELVGQHRVDTDMHTKNPTNKVEGTKITITHGEVRHATGGAIFYDSTGVQFDLLYKHTKSISTDDGGLLWTNAQYQTK